MSFLGAGRSSRVVFFFSSRRRHTRCGRDWSSDVCSSDLSNFHATHVAGPFVVSVTVKPESRDAAVASTLDEIARFLLTGLTRKELKEEKSSRIGKFQVDLASNAGIAQALDAEIGRA